MPEKGSTGRIIHSINSEPLPFAEPVLRIRTSVAVWFIHIGLFFLTLITTTAFGNALAASFAEGRSLDEDLYVTSILQLFHGNILAWKGLVYSIPLLLILFAHEMGHYLTCRRFRVRATLPFFGPSPTLLGTVGAVIWIRSPIYSRKSLFDIGVAGPIAGFAMLIPFLIAGVMLSHVSGHGQSAISFGTPLLLRVFEMARFPGISAQGIALHPLAIAAWAGLLATAMNLLPIGQLDGGHILYALFGPKTHGLVSLIAIAGLALLGIIYKPWWIWAALMFIFRRHQLVYDRTPLGRGRMAIACGAAVMLILSFCVVPVDVR